MGEYYKYRKHESEAGWGVAGPGLDMEVPDKGLALAIAKFLNQEPDADDAVKELWLQWKSPTYNNTLRNRILVAFGRLDILDQYDSVAQRIIVSLDGTVVGWIGPADTTREIAVALSNSYAKDNAVIEPADDSIEMRQRSQRYGVRLSGALRAPVV